MIFSPTYIPGSFAVSFKCFFSLVLMPWISPFKQAWWAYTYHWILSQLFLSAIVLVYNKIHHIWESWNYFYKILYSFCCFQLGRIRCDDLIKDRGPSVCVFSLQHICSAKFWYCFILSFTSSFIKIVIQTLNCGVSTRHKRSY